MNHLLILSKEKHVPQKLAPGVGRRHRVDAILSALRQQIQCGHRRRRILTQLRQFTLSLIHI